MLNILPSKHVHFDESLLGLSKAIITLLTSPQKIDALWKKFLEQKEFQNRITYDDFRDAINFLFLLGKVQIDRKGKLYHVTTPTLFE